MMTNIDKYIEDLDLSLSNDMQGYTIPYSYLKKIIEDYHEEELIKELPKVNRLEVIDHTGRKGVVGRAYTNYDVKGIEIHTQDYGETIKIFLG